MDFEWDNGNLLKSLIEHGITKQESEQAFLGSYLLEIDETHSMGEIRFKLLGKTLGGKILHIIFTTRTNKIRIISSRPVSKNERNIYEKKVKKTP